MLAALGFRVLRHRAGSSVRSEVAAGRGRLSWKLLFLLEKKGVLFFSTFLLSQRAAR
jgi:hypothetical protein